MKPEPDRSPCVAVESLESRQLLAAVPAGFVDESVVTGLDLPTAAQVLPDGRLLIAEQGGTLRVVKDGALLPAPALSLPVDSQGERGLVGVAADPDFATNHFIYVYHTLPSAPIHNEVSRFTMTGDVADPSSELDLLDLDNLSAATNHNGGSLHFGADGKLYVAVGDNALGANSQSLNNRLGKLLRINPDGSIPADNPFYNTASGANRAIWALGLRNPFEFAVQPGTGRLLINDVGQSSFEEVDEGIPGSNYGWPVTEGPTSDPRFVPPIYSYTHADGSSAITGGTFYNPARSTFPASDVGSYFFADLTGNYIKCMTFPNGVATVSPFATDTGSIVDLDVGTDGSLYYLRINEGDLRRIRATTTAPPTSAPTIDAAPQPQKVAAGHPATFSVQASGAAPLTYQWQRNGKNIFGATSPTYTLPAATLKDSGATFRVVVTNSAGSVTSTAAKLTVGRPPVVTLTAPSTFDAGKTLLLTARATDSAGRPLPPKSFKWSVELRDSGTIQTVLPSKKGTPTLTLSVPLRQRSTTAFYRVTLIVTDSLGIPKTTTRKIHPHLVHLTLRPSVPGPTITLDNQPVKKKTLAVAGSRHTLAVATPPPTGGLTYLFLQWSDGPRKPRRPLIISPQGNFLTAEFRTIGTSVRSVPVTESMGF